jgi:hypothetical protein
MTYIRPALADAPYWQAGGDGAEEIGTAMATRQRIVRSRREYNQWVANQTLEDYALRFTAKSARKWSAARVANTALGGISFLALEAIGGTITVGYGFTNAVAAILLVGLLIFAAGVPIAIMPHVMASISTCSHAGPGSAISG